MSYLVTYYPNKDVIQCLRHYKKCMAKFIADSKGSYDVESEAQSSFERLLSSLKKDIELNRYASIFDVKSLGEIEGDEYERFLNQEINIVAETVEGSTARSEAIVYRTLSFLGSNDNSGKISDVISAVTASHYHSMQMVRDSRRKTASEKGKAKRKIRASVEYITVGTAILVVNNTLGVGVFQIPSSTLGAGAILRGIADIRGV